MYDLRGEGSIDVSIGKLLTPEVLGYHSDENRNDIIDSGEEVHILHPAGAKRFRCIADDIIGAIRAQQKNIFDMYDIDYDEFYSDTNVENHTNTLPGGSLSKNPK